MAPHESAALYDHEIDHIDDMSESSSPDNVVRMNKCARSLAQFWKKSRSSDCNDIGRFKMKCVKTMETAKGCNVVQVLTKKIRPYQL